MGHLGRPAPLTERPLRIPFAHALIATGACPRALDIPGADIVPTVTSDDLMHVTELPGHLVCVGAGAVSLEFAQAYRRLGAEVTIVQRGAHLAHGEDEELGDLLKAYLEEEAVRVLTDAEVVRLELVDGRPVVVTADGSRVVGDEVLLAVGRGAYRGRPGARRRRHRVRLARGRHRPPACGRRCHTSSRSAT